MLSSRFSFQRKTGVLALALSALSAVSASASQDASAVRISIPESRIARTEAVSESKGSFSPTFALGVSSWAPAGVGIATYRSGPVRFRADFPMAYASMGIPLGTMLKTDVSAVIGLGFLSMTREMIDIDGTQNLGIFSGTLELEAQPRKLNWGKGFAHFSLGALPTAISAVQSSVSDAGTVTGIPVEVSAGAFFSFSYLGMSGNQLGLDFNVAQILGTSSSIEASGTVAKTALRVTLP